MESKGGNREAMFLEKGNQERVYLQEQVLKTHLVWGKPMPPRNFV